MSNPNVEPLAQDYAIAAQVPDPDEYFFHDPNMTRLDDGRLIIAAPQWQFLRCGGARSLRILRSEDHGQTWQELTALPYEEGTPFVIDGQLLMFVQEMSHRHFQIVGSDDGGLTWTAPQTVLEGPLWNIGTAMVTRPDVHYWAMDYDSPHEDENGKVVNHNGKVMVKLDKKKSPLDPDAWSMSNIVLCPELPPPLTRNLFPPGRSPQIASASKRSMTWLEPNTVDVGGRIRLFARCNIDNNATAHIAGVLDYDADADRLSFTQFTAWPGGQCKFYVVHDQPGRMYWLLSNLVTNSQDLLGWGRQMRESGYTGGPGNERRWLFLHYSIDCLSWFPAGCVARWPSHLKRSFMYPCPVIDGQDLIVLSRTSRDAGNQHDADCCTVHLISNFRELAMDLHQGGLQV